MRIAICEDNPEDSAHLCVLLSGYLDANRLVADMEAFASGEALLDAFAPGKYQIIFFDIYLDDKGVSGIKAAETIRAMDSEVSIIFTTTSIEHGPTSYEVKADYYIVKPVDRKRLEKALERCRLQLDRYAMTMEVSVNRQTERIRLRDVLYVEARKHNVLLHTSSGEIRTRTALGEVTEKLGGPPFIPCHRSYMVNLVNVADLRDNSFIMKNGDRVPVSRTYQEKAHEAFKAFFWES